MAALTSDYDSSYQEGPDRGYPVAAGVKIYDGAIVVLNSGGYAQPGSTALGLSVVGEAEEQVDNTDGENGDRWITVRRGCFSYDTGSGDDQITEANVDGIAWLVDDHTIAATNGGNTRSPAGVVDHIDQEGNVFAIIGCGPLPLQAGSLVAANNLDDVENAQTARQNIGANVVVETVAIPDLSVAGQQVYFAAAKAGTITKITATLQGALTVGNATIQANINNTAITNGLITEDEAGSAAGQVASASPTALNTVAQGDVISFTVAGTNTAHTAAIITVEIDT